jgi:esterase/lipase superfamily enzyme
VKFATRWYSERLAREVAVVRWGHYGVPVIIFATAGGDAEEIERFDIIASLRALIDAGRIKVYSCDSVSGRAMLVGEGSPEHRMWLLSQYHEFVRHELVPAIRYDCRSAEIEIMAAGASIGAFNAVAVLCRYPDVFTKALGLSGTYDLHGFIPGDMNEHFYLSSPLHFLPNLNGETLVRLRKRFVLLAAGEGRWENVGESWRMAHVLGTKEIPNRMDPWGPDWHHEWPTWRRMFAQYLEEMTREAV